MYQKTKSATTGSIIFLMMLMSLWALSPSIKNEINQAYILVISLLCLFLLGLGTKGKFATTTFSILLLMSWLILYKIIGISDETWASHSNQFVFFLTMLISLFLTGRCERERLKKISIILLIYVFINLLYQVYLYYRVGGSLYHARMLMEQGVVVGTTSFVTVVMFLGAVLTIVILNTSKKNIKWLCIIYIIAIYFYLLYVQSRATAIILLTLFIAFCILLGFEEKPSIGRIVAFVSICIVFLIVLPFIVNLIAQSGNEYYARKFFSISEFLSGDMIIGENIRASSFNYRLYVAGVSLRTWLSSPLVFLFGKGYDQGFYLTTGIGRHSEIIDFFPRYGIVGVSIAFWAVRSYYRTMSVMMPIKRSFLYFFAFVIIYSIFNGIFLPEVAVTVNIICPFILLNLCERRDVHL